MKEYEELREFFERAEALKEQLYHEVETTCSYVDGLRLAGMADALEQLYLISREEAIHIRCCAGVFNERKLLKDKP